MPKRLSAKHGVTRYIVKDSCALLGPSHRGLVENFRADLNKSLSQAFPTGSIDLNSMSILSLMALLFDNRKAQRRTMATSRLSPRTLLVS